jgi:serine/threonine protein phosphatase PrpC
MQISTADPSGRRWRTICSSITGPGHVGDGRPNQDRATVFVVDDSCWLLAVADGAGSRSRAADGAEFATSAARSAATRIFGRHRQRGPGRWKSAAVQFRQECLRLFDSAVYDAQQRLSADPACHESQHDIRDSFATTLLAAVVQPPYIAYVSVGDCFLVVDRDGGIPHLVVSPPEREYTNETTFLTSARRDTDAEHGVIVDDRINAIAVCSDGVAEALLAARPAAGGWLSYYAPSEFRSYFDYFGDPRVDPQELELKLGSPEFARTSADDKSVAMACRAAYHGGTPGDAQ